VHNKIKKVLAVLLIDNKFFFNDCTARVSQLMVTIHSTRKRHLKLIQQLQQYMRYKELPYSLQRRLLTYYDYRNKKGFERDKIIINHVSPYLREVRGVFKNFLRKVVFLCKRSLLMQPHSINNVKTIVKPWPEIILQKSFRCCILIATHEFSSLLRKKDK